MVLDYSKFDHIGDSDEDQPDPKVLQEAERRRQLAEEFKAQISSEKAPQLAPTALDGGLALARAAQEAAVTGTVEPLVNLPAHKVDRFAHSDQDITDVAQESLRLVLSKQLGITAAGGVLSLASIDAIEGDATRLQLQGTARYIYDFNLVLSLAFKWLGSNFEAGMQRVDARLELDGVSSDLQLEKTTEKPGESQSANPPLETHLSWLPNQKLLEAKLQAALEEAVGLEPSSWPPPTETFLGQVVASLQRWACKLPDVVEARLEERRRQKQQDRSAHPACH